MHGSSTQALVERLAKATNDHDLDALGECFAVDYLNETPVHPTRGFRGRDQVRRNWEQIFAFVPDLTATVVVSAVEGDTACTEWEMTGTRRDGTTHHMRGVIVFNVQDDVAQSARLYLEPVDTQPSTVDEAVRAQVAR
ncbi:MAG: nuclear transport factor 2 family protein [bacterium]